MDRKLFSFFKSSVFLNETYSLFRFLIRRFMSWLSQGRDAFPLINSVGIHSSTCLFKVDVKDCHNSSTDLPLLSDRKKKSDSFACGLWALSNLPYQTNAILWVFVFGWKVLTWTQYTTGVQEQSDLSWGILSGQVSFGMSKSPRRQMLPLCLFTNYNLSSKIYCKINNHYCSKVICWSVSCFTLACLCHVILLSGNSHATWYGPSDHVAAV